MKKMHSVQPANKYCHGIHQLWYIITDPQYHSE